MSVIRVSRRYSTLSNFSFRSKDGSPYVAGHALQFERHDAQDPRFAILEDQEWITALPEQSGDDVPINATAQDEEPAFNPDWRFRAAFFSLMIINLAAALDATSLSVALPIIAKELKGTAIEAFWSGTSFLLTSTVLQPIFASFSHIFGRKPILLLSLVFFAVGAVLAAIAKNFTLMLIGRSIQGVGGGGIIALTDIIITDIIPLRERGKWFGLVSIMWAIGSVTGPVMGGAFAEKVSWTWIFWINIPLIGIGFALIPPFLKLHGRQEDFMRKVARVDYVGSTIFVAATTAFLIPISWGGVQYAWSSWRTIAPLFAGVAGINIFLVYENLYAKEPTIPLHIFRNPTTSIAFFNTFVHGVILWSVLYYLPLYFEAVKGYTPIIAGVACFPETFTVAPMTVLVAIVVQFTGKYRWALWSGWVIATAGMGILHFLDVATPIWQWVLLNLVPGVGLGLLFPAMGFSIQASAPQKDAAHAVAMFTFFRGLGQSVGVAVGGVIFQNRIKARLLKFDNLAAQASEYARDASALVQIIKSLPASAAAVKDNLKIAYADALKWVWLVMCVFAGIAMITSWFVRSYTLDQELETEQGFKYEDGREAKWDHNRNPNKVSKPQKRERSVSDPEKAEEKRKTITTVTAAAMIEEEKNKAKQLDRERLLAARERASSMRTARTSRSGRTTRSGGSRGISISITTRRTHESIMSSAEEQRRYWEQQRKWEQLQQHQQSRKSGQRSRGGSPAQSPNLPPQRSPLIPSDGAASPATQQSPFIPSSVTSPLVQHSPVMPSSMTSPLTQHAPFMPPAYSPTVEPQKSPRLPTPSASPTIQQTKSPRKSEPAPSKIPQPKSRRTRPRPPPPSSPEVKNTPFIPPSAPSSTSSSSSNARPATYHPGANRDQASEDMLSPLTATGMSGQGLTRGGIGGAGGEGRAGAHVSAYQPYRSPKIPSPLSREVRNHSIATDF